MLKLSPGVVVAMLRVSLNAPAGGVVMVPHHRRHPQQGIVPSDPGVSTIGSTRYRQQWLLDRAEQVVTLR